MLKAPIFLRLPILLPGLFPKPAPPSLLLIYQIRPDSQSHLDHHIFHCCLLLPDSSWTLDICMPIPLMVMSSSQRDWATWSSTNGTKAKALNSMGLKTSTTSPYWQKNCHSSSAVMSSVQHPVNTFLLPKGSCGLWLEFGSLQSHCCPSITCCCDVTFTWVSYSVKWTKSNPFKWQVFRICIYLAVSGFISCGIWTFSCGMCDLLIIPWTGIEPRPSVLGVQSLSHWATKEVPEWPVLVSFLTQTLRTSPKVLKYSFRSCCFPWETQHYFWTTFLTFTADEASIFLLLLLW